MSAVRALSIPLAARTAGVAAAAVLLAIAVRVALLAEKPFWRDEASTAVLVELPTSVVIKGERAVPVGFVMAVKAVAPLAVILSSEVAYRLVPLACGLATVALLPLLARQLRLEEPTPVTALWLSAGLPALVYYSRELKAYSVDLLLAILVPLLAHRILADDRHRRRWQVALLLVVGAAPWVSFGGLFPIAATLLWALIATMRQPQRRRPWLAALLVLVVSLAGVYGLILHRQVTNPGLLETWRGDFSGGQVDAAGLLAALVRPHVTVFGHLFPHLWPVALVLAAVGIVSCAPPARRLLLWVWVVPAAAASLAAIAKLYLVSQGRLLLFLAPPVVLSVAIGLTRVAGLLPARARGLGTAAAAAFSLWWAGASIDHRLHSKGTDSRRFFLFDVLQDVEPLVAHLDRQGTPGSQVMVTRYAGHSFRYYQRGRLAGATVCTMTACRDEPRVIVGWLDGLRDGGWMILTDQETGGERRLLARNGYVVLTEVESRGMRLWRVARRRAA